MRAWDLTTSAFFLGDRGSAIIAFRRFLDFYANFLNCTMAAEAVDDAKIFFFFAGVFLYLEATGLNTLRSMHFDQNTRIL